MSKIEELEKLRAERREAATKQRDEQHAKDLEALLELEDLHGFDALRRLNTTHFVPGIPTFAVIKSPGGSAVYKRYTDKVRKAQKQAQLIGAAQEELGISCLVYPTGEAAKAMIEAFPGMPISIAVAAINMVELQDDVEKKD